ncbi:abortive infection system antitoxin AbiGi family protein [Mesorhizobium sp. LjNodule214]|uniref:abortive infection system antitoxin AbiGi family protein n=1 Tax=Mesorhizobium sp. LjNodule214 TaxID=3342252 RepID=UPI003ECE02C9
MDEFLDHYDRAVHSDFLIHWTGKDLDKEHSPSWHTSGHRSRTSPELDQLYLERLRNILTYGLWMTEEGERTRNLGTAQITIPATPQCCFTELKLSESRRHAKSYGRLGIGVKRPFLFQRFGRPLAYFGYGEENSDDKFLEACSRDLRDKSLLNFFKPMNRDKLTYEYYAESEWRILYFEELLRDRKIIDPRDNANAAHHEYFKGLPPEHQRKLKYLIPLDGWFAMIIYPCLSIKNRAQWETKLGILDQIEKIKSVDDHGNRVEGPPGPRTGNWPIEVDLDATMHF